MARGQLWRRLPGPAKRYAPIDGRIPPGVSSKNGSISTRQFNALASVDRGYAKERKFSLDLVKENAKKKVTRSVKADYIRQHEVKTGVKLTRVSLDKDAEYKNLLRMLDSKKKDGTRNKTDRKRALVGLGLRDGIPWGVQAGQSNKRHRRLANGSWVLKDGFK